MFPSRLREGLGEGMPLAVPLETSPPPTPPASGRGDLPVTLAAVAGAHGVTGEVRLKVFADDLAAFASFNDGALTVKSLRLTPQGAIARFIEVSNRNAAEALRGTALTVPRSALPPLDEGEYYHADLIGLAAENAAGARIGEVVAVQNFGAGDLLEIRLAGSAKTVLVPFRDAFVPVVDMADRKIKLADVPGLLD